MEVAVERIKEAVNPLAIVLFGSRSKGEAAYDSDIDLLIVVSTRFDDSNSRIKAIGRIEDALGNFSLPTDILLYSKEEIDIYRRFPNHVVADAVNKGRVLYGEV